MLGLYPMIVIIIPPATTSRPINVTQIVLRQYGVFRISEIWKTCLGTIGPLRGPFLRFPSPMVTWARVTYTGMTYTNIPPPFLTKCVSLRLTASVNQISIHIYSHNLTKTFAFTSYAIQLLSYNVPHPQK